MGMKTGSLVAVGVDATGGNYQGSTQPPILLGMGALPQWEVPIIASNCLCKTLSTSTDGTGLLSAYTYI